MTDAYPFPLSSMRCTLSNHDAYCNRSRRLAGSRTFGIPLEVLPKAIQVQESDRAPAYFAEIFQYPPSGVELRILLMEIRDPQVSKVNQYSGR